MATSLPTTGELLGGQRTQPKTVTTYQALVIVGLQEEYFTAGNSSVVNQSSGFLEKILALIPKFRDRAGYLIWVPSEPSGSEDLPRTARDVDRFIGALRNKQPQPWTGKVGAFQESVQKLVDPKVDIVMDAPYGTISTSMSFMTTMYTQVITKIFICGCVTDTSIYTLMLDSAKKGWDVVLIDDCLGFSDKDKKKHKIALKQTREKLFAETITSKEIFADLDEPTEPTISSKELGEILDTLLTEKGKQKLNPTAEEVVEPVNKEVEESKKGQKKRKSRPKEMSITGTSESRIEPSPKRSPAPPDETKAESSNTNIDQTLDIGQ